MARVSERDMFFREAGGEERATVFFAKHSASIATLKNEAAQYRWLRAKLREERSEPQAEE